MAEQQNICDYFITHSPLSELANQPSHKLTNFKNEVDTKIRLLTSKNKNYLPTIKLSSQSYSEMKASSIIHNIPEFSPPEVNFQISDKVRQKVNRIKEDIIGKFPTIKSSNYNAGKLDTHFNHRTMIKELQEWLREKLRNPPLNYEESIEYKNMIMGMGMKEIIRIINTRCVEEGNMVNEVWELTWSICREIILYLSKRAKKCEDILEEEMNFIKNYYEKNLIQLQKETREIRIKYEVINERFQKVSKDLTKNKKKNKQLKIIKLKLQHENQSLKREYSKLLQDNMSLVMQQGTHKQKDWVKKMYKNLSTMKEDQKNFFEDFIGKVMKENQPLLNSDDLYGDFQIRNDMNAFIEEEKNRKFRLAEELANNMKTFSVKTQTQFTTYKERGVNVEHALMQNKGFGTEVIVTTETGTNTKNGVKIAGVAKKPHDIRLASRNLRTTVTKKSQTRRRDSLLKIDPDELTNRTIKDDRKSQKKIEKAETKDICVECNIEREGEDFSRTFSQRNQFKRKQSFRNNGDKNDEKQKQLERTIEIMKNEKNTLIDHYENQIAQVNEKLMEQAKLILLYEDTKFTSRQSLKRFNINLNERNRSCSLEGQQNIISISQNQRTQNNENNYHLNVDSIKVFKTDHKMVEDSNKYSFSGLNSQAESSINSQNQDFKNSTRNFGGIRSYKDSPKQSSVFLQDFPKEDGKMEEGNSKFHLNSLNYSQMFFNSVRKDQFEAKSHFNIHNTHNAKENIQIMEEYKDISKTISQIQESKNNQKQFKSTIEKNIFPVLKQLHVGMKKHTEKLHELKGHYNSLSAIVAHRFNRNFGVKKVASKHLRNLLLSLKFVHKYTNKYSIIAYFMLDGYEDPVDIELFFIYILLTSQIDPTFTGEKTLSVNEIRTMRSLCSEYLTSYEPLYENLNKLEAISEGYVNFNTDIPNTFIDIYKIIILEYKEIKSIKSKKYSFLFDALSWIGGFTIRKFISFISVFRKSASWQDKIVSELIHCCKENPNYDGIVSFNSFIRFVLNSQEFSLEKLSALLQENKSNKNEKKSKKLGKQKNDEESSLENLSQTKYKAEKRKKRLENMGSYSQLTYSIVKYMLQNENMAENEEKFLEKYVSYYILQKEVEFLMGSLLTGVLNIKTSELLLSIKK